MPLRYEDPPSWALRQGEILGELWEHRPIAAVASLGADEMPSIQSLLHPRVIVMTADCDLIQDFAVRFNDERPGNYEGILERDQAHSTLLPYVLLCDMYEATDIRSRTPPGSEAWRRIDGNHNQRYHRLAAAAVKGGGALPDLYLDFRKTFALPGEAIYAAVGHGLVRMGLVPPVYLHDLMHRFYGYLSRVGLPD